MTAFFEGMFEQQTALCFDGFAYPSPRRYPNIKTPKSTLFTVKIEDGGSVLCVRFRRTNGTSNNIFTHI